MAKRTSRRENLNRRQFLSHAGKAALGAAALTLPVGRGGRKLWQWIPGFENSVAGTRKRRHLVNLIGAGGSDSSWFLNAFSQSALDGVPNSWVSQDRGGFEYAKSSLPFLLTQKCSDASERELTPHPNPAYGGQIKVGAAMTKAILETDTELNDILIWRGLTPEGSHEIGNNLLLQGNGSSYAVSFSGLVAEALAEVSRRDLHYVLMAPTPGALFTNFAMSHGAQIPVCIPSPDEFKALTELAPQELPEAALRDIIAKTVSKLSEEGLRNSVGAQTSRQVAGAFQDNFNGAVSLYGSNYMSDPEFKWLYKYYLLAISKAFKRAHQDPNISQRAAQWTFGYNTTFDAILDQIGQIVDKAAPLPPLQDVLTNPALASTLSDVTAANPFAAFGITASPYTPSYFATVPTQAFHYALTDFLIRRNKSAVIDAPAWPGFLDSHGGGVGAYLHELLMQIRTFACFRAMIKSFKSIPLTTEEGGGTLFDSTLMVMTTEFDRWPYHNARAFNNVAIHAGTNHGDTASVVLAGYGIKRGTVVGEIHQGPRVHAAYEPAQRGSSYYLRPLPIDPTTGLPKPVSEGGQVISTLALLPTVLAAFGVEVPTQQVTEWGAVDAVIDKSKK